MARRWRSSVHSVLADDPLYYGWEFNTKKLVIMGSNGIMVQEDHLLKTSLHNRMQKLVEFSIAVLVQEMKKNLVWLMYKKTVTIHQTKAATVGSLENIYIA